MTDFRFSSPEYDEAVDRLGGLADKLRLIANEKASKKFGDNAIDNPTDIEITPAALEEPIFIIRAWHEIGKARKRAVMQAHDYSFRVVFEGEDVFMKTEEGNEYPLTTREAFLLVSLGGHALMSNFISEHRGELE